MRALKNKPEIIELGRRGPEQRTADAAAGLLLLAGFVIGLVVGMVVGPW